MSAYTEIPKIVAETGALPPKVLGDLNSRYPGASSQSVEYFVAPPPLGNDNNDGSEDYPLATIAAAISRLPDVIRTGHTYTITLQPGEWAEDCTVEHITIHGQLIFQGSSDDETRHRIRRFEGTNLTGKLLVTNIESTQKNRAAFVFDQAGPHIELINVRNIDDPENNQTSGNHGVLADHGSQVIVRNSHFENKRYAVRANYLSRVFAIDNTGQGNHNGIGARWGGIASIYGTTPDGTTKLTTDSSGLIVHSNGAKIGADRLNPTVGHDELALIQRNELQGLEGRYPVKQWMGRPANLQIFNNDIPLGGRLRLYYRMSDTQPSINSIIEARASYVPLAGGAPRWRKVVFGGMLTQTSMNNTSPQYVAGVPGSDGHEMITFTHAGYGGQFYIDLLPEAHHGAQGSWYGIDVEFSSLRNFSAPILYNAEILGGDQP